MNIQWYPGHMTKAKRAMKEDIKLIDLIIEVVDARVPLASRNPDIDELGKGKARLILLNKSDLSSERYNEAWTNWFREKGYFVVKSILAVVPASSRSTVSYRRPAKRRLSVTVAEAS